MAPRRCHINNLHLNFVQLKLKECKLGFFWHEWASLKRECQIRAQFTLERVEYNVFCSTSPLKAPNRFKLSLTFRFDKL
jgi:hypothetical protein